MPPTPPTPKPILMPTKAKLILIASTSINKDVFSFPPWKRNIQRNYVVLNMCGLVCQSQRKRSIHNTWHQNVLKYKSTALACVSWKTTTLPTSVLQGILHFAIFSYDFNSWPASCLLLPPSRMNPNSTPPSDSFTNFETVSKSWPSQMVPLTPTTSSPSSTNIPGASRCETKTHAQTKEGAWHLIFWRDHVWEMFLSQFLSLEKLQKGLAKKDRVSIKRQSKAHPQATPSYSTSPWIKNHECKLAVACDALNC